MAKESMIGKGHATEELLRSYFLGAGYFVVRGVPFAYEGFDVTDIDLWLYSRTSSFSREITIVDIKNKKTPQAIERIFWVQGLRLASKATRAIVATTDRRPEVKDFGKELDTLVLDGSFLSGLGGRENITPLRLSDEEFAKKLDEYPLAKYDGDWKGRLRLCKSLLSKGLTFDSCNEWLGQGRFFAECAISNELQRENALRCLYLVAAFIMISIDYLLKDLLFLEQHDRIVMLDEGFKYGSKGRLGLKKIVQIAIGLIEENASDGIAASRQVSANIERQLEELNTKVLAEFFSRSDMVGSLFDVALEFESLAMQRNFSSHQAASTDLKSALYCLLDHWRINRSLLVDRQRRLTL